MADDPMQIDHKGEKDLLTPVRRFRRRWLAQNFLDVMTLLCWGGAGLFLALVWIDKLFTIALPDVPMAALVLTTVSIVAVAIVLWNRPSLLRAAQLLDERAGTRERISSAVELRNHYQGAPGEHWHECERAVWQDALRRVQSLGEGSWFRWRPPRRWKAMAVTIAALGLSSFAPRFDLLGRQSAEEGRRAEAKLVSEQVAKVERVVERTRQLADEQDLKDVARISRDLKTELQQMRQRPPARREALQQLSNLEDRLEKERQGMKAGEQARQKLGSNPLTKKLAEELKAGNLEGARAEAEKLKEQIASGQLGEGEKKQLQKDLAAALDSLPAKNSSSSRPAESGRKSESPSESEQGPAASDADLQQMAGDLSDQLDSMSGQALSSEQMDRMMRQMAQCKANIGGPMGNQPGAQRTMVQRMAASGQSGSSGQSNFRQSGSTPQLEENGSTNLNQPGGPGRSWSSRTLPPREYVQLYDPRRTEAPGEDLRSQSALGNQGAILGTMEVDGIPKPEQPAIPYSENFESFRTAAEDALDRDQVPLKYRPIVRRYFDSVDSMAQEKTTENGE